MKKLFANKLNGTFFFWLVFISMCVLKLWFTLLLIFGFAIAITFLQKKRSYCSNLCPVGMIQDQVYSEKQGKRKSPVPSIVRKSVFVIFWAYIFTYIFLLYDQTGLLWAKMLQLMLFSLITSLLLQRLFRKRFWCSQLCPVGSVLTQVVRIRV